MGKTSKSGRKRRQVCPYCQGLYKGLGIHISKRHPGIAGAGIVHQPRIGSSYTSDGSSKGLLSIQRIVDNPTVSNPFLHPPWNRGIVPVRIGPDFTIQEKYAIRNGLRMISNPTCIKFRPATSKDTDYVYIQRGKDRSGCGFILEKPPRSSSVINIEGDSYCMEPGSIAHEMLHALGLYHEMCRPDRDEYIIILWENIADGMAHNWRKLENASVYGTEYDYQSIMHYSSRAGSKNGKPVMLNKEGHEIKMGQRERLTENDIKKINAMYKCS